MYSAPLMCENRLVCGKKSADFRGRLKLRRLLALVFAFQYFSLVYLLRMAGKVVRRAGPEGGIGASENNPEALAV